MEEVIEYVKKLEIGEQEKYNNLAIFPLIGQDSKLEHIVLSEAIKEGFVISEKGGGSVPLLYSVNRTGKKVLAIAGEYVVGGRQNRTLTRTVYFGGDFAGDLPVRCVQHGRWSYGSERAGFFGVDSGHAARFRAAGQVPISACAAARDQGETWHHVDMMLADTGVDDETRDLHAVYEEKKEDFDKYKKNFSIKTRQIGNLAVISRKDKKMFVVDLFDRNEILKKYHPNLISSYALEAGLKEDSDIETSQEEARSFLEKLESCKFQEQKAISEGRDYVIKGKKIGGNVLLVNSVPVYLNMFSRNGESGNSDAVLRARDDVFNEFDVDLEDDGGIIGTFREDDEDDDVVI